MEIWTGIIPKSSEFKRIYSRNTKNLPKSLNEIISDFNLNALKKLVFSC